MKKEKKKMPCVNPKSMKRVKCPAPGCAGKRIHHERPDTPRGPQYNDVPDDYYGLTFCSLECQMYWNGTNKKKIWKRKKEKEEKGWA